MHPNLSNPLGIKIQINVLANIEFALFAHIKSLIDGIIASFQQHDSAELDRILERLSLSLQEDSAVLRSALMDGAHASLGTTNLLLPYRSGVKWNPADHRFVHVKLQVEQTLDDMWSHCGEIFVVERTRNMEEF